MNKPLPANSVRLPEEAAQWFLRLQEGGASSEIFIEWQQWLNAAPEHRAAYDEIEDTALRLSRISQPPQLPSADELARDSYDGSQPVAGWRESQRADSNGQRDSHRADSTPARRPRPAWHRVFAIAAGIVAVGFIGAMWWRYDQVTAVAALSYETPPGQRRLIRLPDGSTVTLDADSKLEVELSPSRRSLSLQRGEAYFQVAKDAVRPFVVSTGSAQVTAVGTAFDVRLSDDRTVVAVTEGRIEFVATPKDNAPPVTAVTPSNLPQKRAQLAARVAAGEAVSYRDNGDLQALPERETSIATAWLEGRRQYRNEPLRYVLADVDRYTGQRIELANDGAGDLRFTGTLNLDDSTAWLRGLSVALPVIVSNKDDGALLITRRVGPGG